MAARRTSAKRRGAHAQRCPSATSRRPLSRAACEAIAGAVHLRLGHTVEAIEHLTAATGLRDHADAKGRALLTFDLAEVAFRSGEPDHAAGLAHRAPDTAAGQYVRHVR